MRRTVSCTAAHLPPAPPSPDSCPHHSLHYVCAAGAEHELHLEFEATKGQSPVINREGITVGRAPGCDLRLDAPSASDRHARLHQCGEWRRGCNLNLVPCSCCSGCWCSTEWLSSTRCSCCQLASSPTNTPAPNPACGQGRLSRARPGTLHDFTPLNCALLPSLRLSPAAADKGDYHVTDLGSHQGTYLNGKRLAANAPHRLLPSDELCFGSNDLGGKRFKVGRRWTLTAHGSVGSVCLVPGVHRRACVASCLALFRIAPSPDPPARCTPSTLLRSRWCTTACWRAGGTGRMSGRARCRRRRMPPTAGRTWGPPSEAPPRAAKCGNTHAPHLTLCRQCAACGSLPLARPFV